MYNNQKIRKRIDWIDIGKGIGIFYVMLSHKEMGILAGHITSLFMPLFFFLSGCTFSIKDNDTFKTFLRRKSKSLVVPYLAISTLLYGIYISKFIIKFLLQHSSIQLNNFITPFVGYLYSVPFLYDIKKAKILGINNPNLVISTFNPFWFILCLFVMEIIFYFIVSTSKNKKQIIIKMVACAFTGYLINTFIIIQLPWSIDKALSSIIFLGLGYLIKNMNISPEIDWKKVILIIIFTIINITFYKLNSFVNISTREYGNYFYFYIAAISGIGIYIIISQVIAKKINILKKFFVFIGQNTFTLLSFHLITYSIVDKIFSILKINLEKIQNTIFYGAIYAVLTIIILLPVITVINKKVPWIVGKKVSSS
ncbi:acyltransferase family protein [Clostridium ragsdalei P11]|uniref:Acyltransferase family protein n=1 Tax=Clostridium ragsdalei P11 TaxID=1353534 RepID=A0A1A6AIK9_9CLOT|nr:acyltransferase family protein [Clostridium ragsdalei]OBR89905.1 acyltransferase family protein [Clostridium ragsdalei P11]